MMAKNIEESLAELQQRLDEAPAAQPDLWDENWISPKGTVHHVDKRYTDTLHQASGGKYLKHPDPHAAAMRDGWTRVQSLPTEDGEVHLGLETTHLHKALPGIQKALQKQVIPVNDVGEDPVVHIGSEEKYHTVPYSVAARGTHAKITSYRKKPGMYMFGG